MDGLESFVAGRLLDRLVRARREAGVARVAFQGAALFVDISGYTNMAETLCALGPDGVEQLGKTLDSAFRAQSRAVRDTGGEIACFAGDAFLAYWPADDDAGAAGALARARQCASVLHAESRVQPPAPVPEVPLHIGIGAGELWAARLGADERWHVLLAGAAVRDACAASVRAGPGETVIAPFAGPLIDGRLDAPARTTLGGSPAPGLAEVLSHVPRRVQEYTAPAYSAWVAQRRTMCAVFVRIDGLDDAGPDAFSRHQIVAASIQMALRPYTGSGGTLLLDDKGLLLTVCLGTPNDAHADDAVRAARAGLAIRRELGRIGLRSAIGIASGAGVCMPLGGPERKHYWIGGRFMHIAARLMESAQDGILCTDDIADRVRHVAALSPERPLTVKGVRWPIPVFQIRESALVDDRVDALFGREDEQAALDKHLDAFVAGRGTVLWIVGDAGIGKTALVNHLRRSAARRGIECLSGGATSIEIAAAYSAWRPLFAALLDVADTPAGEAERRGRLGALRHPQLASLVNAVVPGYLEETTVVQNLAGQARADATSSLLSDVLVAHATERFVLILEDCHWMDSASWRLALRVAQERPDALIVLTSRPVPDVQELAAIRGLDRFVPMKLAPLRPAAIEAIAEYVLEQAGGSRTLVQEVAHRAVGNPLFAREYSLLLAARARDAGAAPERAQASPGSSGMPVTVESLIASRLDGLPPSEDLALKTASVIGDRFAVGLLAPVCPAGVAAGQLESTLANLVARQLIVETDPLGHAFAFEHALIREVAYRQLTLDQRRDLHLRVARTIEQQSHEDLRPHLTALAHHWAQADVPASAMRYADDAASQALIAGAFEEADRLLRRCIELADRVEPRPDDAARVRWYRQVADARHGMGQLEPRRAAAHSALRLAGLSRPHTSFGLLAHAAAAMGGYCRHRISRGRRRADAGYVLDVARAYRHSAEVCYFNNDMLGMVCDSLSAVAYAGRLAPSPVLAGAATELGGILGIAGLRRTGERILLQAIAMAEAADDHAGQAYAHMVSCLYSVGIGEWETAERSARRCQELCEPLDDRVNWTNAQVVRFWMSHYQSLDASAFDAARSLRDRAAETGNRQHRAWGFRCLALCALRRGDPQEASVQLRAALDCLGDTAAVNERFPTLGILALAQLQCGDVWAARAIARETLAQIVNARRAIGHSTLEGYSALVAVALHAWREERSPEWHRAIRHCLKMLRRYWKSFPVGEPRYQLHRGEYRQVAGHMAAARRSYRRGAASARRLGMPWEAHRCDEALDSLSHG